MSREMRLALKRVRWLLETKGIALGDPRNDAHWDALRDALEGLLDG